MDTIGYYNKDSKCILIFDKDSVEKLLHYQVGFQLSETERKDVSKRGLLDLYLLKAHNETQNKDILMLFPEEAFYLLNDHKSLRIKDSIENLDELNIDEIWSRFFEKDPKFPYRYAAYKYLKSKDWIVRSGLNYGTDFVLYKKNCPNDHAPFAAVVIPVDNQSDVIDWQPLTTIRRVVQSVNKELLLIFTLSDGEKIVSRNDIQNLRIIFRKFTKLDDNLNQINELDMKSVVDNVVKEPKIKSSVSKRDDYLDWNDYFTAIACLTAKRTKNLSESAGACIVNEQNKILGIGYNSAPTDVEEELIRFNGLGADLAYKDNIVHAELNAILNCVMNVQVGCSMYVSRFPCHECAKAIIQAGIKHLYYASNEVQLSSPSYKSIKTAKLLFKLGGIKYTQSKLVYDLNKSISMRYPSTEDYLDQDSFFMSVAKLAAERSKDPSTQVGACIVNNRNKIIATGYNGMPNGIHDDLVPWSKEGSFLNTKYAYVVHAELNAILNCILTDQQTSRLYVTLFPCNECSKAIIQSGIRRIIYLSDKHKEKDSTKAAKIMLKLAGVQYEKFSS